VSEREVRPLHRVWLLLRTVPRLGLPHVAAVAVYRLALRAGWFVRRLPVRAPARASVYALSSAPRPPSGVAAAPLVAAAGAALDGELTFFSRHRFQVGSPPDWFLNPFNGRRVERPDAHWSRVRDFDAALGDIKAVWELSRWDWALLFARAHCLTGRPDYLRALVDWSDDWVARNPVNQGPQWRCGQEVAIRMLTALLAARLLGQHVAPAAGLPGFVAHHCRRIVPTRFYAVAQRNNHALSEAAALYVGGAWLMRSARAGDAFRSEPWRWYRLGRRAFQRAVLALVCPDGSFSQASLNYHRLLLDLLNVVEFWRRELDLEPLSDAFYGRARAALDWMAALVDPATGDAPNLGANDGARLFPLSAAGYRDYRPTVQLASLLFRGRLAYAPGPWDEPLHWLGLAREKLDLAREKPGLARGGPDRALDSPESRVFPHGGYVVLRSPGPPGSWALLRVPRFRFRPAHADGLHLDLWVAGLNLLRDGGSYSYADPDASAAFRSVACHNTAQCDGRDQMLPLGRFLYGGWLRLQKLGPLRCEPHGVGWTGAYRDYRGCLHRRSVAVHDRVWRVHDRVDGARVVVLRWRLAPDSWRLDGSTLTGARATIAVAADGPCRVSLEPGWESRCYLEKTPVPVLTVELRGGSCSAVTTVQLHAEGS